MKLLKPHAELFGFFRHTTGSDVLAEELSRPLQAHLRVCLRSKGCWVVSENHGFEERLTPIVETHSVHVLIVAIDKADVAPPDSICETVLSEVSEGSANCLQQHDESR